jgi:3-oxoacyl-[acyl-carrier-protein] synthase-3
VTGSRIAAIEYHLPERVLDNAALAAEFPDWTVDKIARKTGIKERRLAGPGETASDLAAKAARKLFASGETNPASIDYVILCTQSPDYLLPTTACLLQDRLGIPTHAGALDINLGCSGFVYGLSLAKGLIETGQARTVLLLTAETYSKYMHPSDRSVRTLFGDAAAATLVEATQAPTSLGPFVFGTDGSGGENLIVKTGGTRNPGLVGPPGAAEPGPDWLWMNGPEIFAFTLRVVPEVLDRLLGAADLNRDDVDQYVMHQANAYMLSHLRKKIGVPEERFVMALQDCGNTVSSTIPIAIKHAVADGRIEPGHLLALVGFGVGFSWGAGLVRWG